MKIGVLSCPKKHLARILNLLNVKNTTVQIVRQRKLIYLVKENSDRVKQGRVGDTVVSC